MKRNLCLFVLLMLGGHQAAFGQFIEIRLSYKVILNPANGSRPSGADDLSISNNIAAMNALMANYQRGFRFRQIGPIEDVGGSNDFTGPSRYYEVNFNSGDIVADASHSGDIEGTARSHTNIYQWRNNAINIYINHGTIGGFCSPPDDLASEQIVLLGPNQPPRTHLHEIGHFFFLWHTQGDICACTPGFCSVPGDDHVSDTLWDLSSWTQDDLARWFFNGFNGRSYDQLNAAEQERVDNTYSNIMSYHDLQSCGQGVHTDRLTERQLDRFADAATGVRNYVVSGQTRFVDWLNGCNEPAGNSGCNDFNFGGPFRRVQDAITAADSRGGDLVVIRPGHYNERQLRISKPLTLRATRAGPVAIGRP